MVLNNWYISDDTVKITDGVCTFTGVIDSFPRNVSLGFPYPSQVRTHLILEPGHIEVTYSKANGFKIGGTENNLIMQRLLDELKPFQDSVAKTWRDWSVAYNKPDRNKQECEAAFDIAEEAKRLQADKIRQIIKENPNYPGLIISLQSNRYETYENLKFAKEQFAAFSNDYRYKSLLNDFEAAERTTSGRPVPGFTFPDPKGNMVSLSSFRGKWVLIDFWYHNCHWCRKLTPHLINIYNDWKDEKDFEIVSISVDKHKDYEKWLQAIEEDKTPWTHVLDSTKTYPLEYGVTGYPSLIIIDKEGNGRERIVGYHEEGSLRRIIGKYLQ
jgi:peroxiredoxin